MSLYTNLSPTLFDFISPSPVFGQLISCIILISVFMQHDINILVYRVTYNSAQSMDHLRWDGCFPESWAWITFFYLLDTWSRSLSVQRNQPFHLPTNLTAIFFLDSNAIYLLQWCNAVLWGTWVWFLSSILYPSVTQGIPRWNNRFPTN